LYIQKVRASSSLFLSIIKNLESESASIIKSAETLSDAQPTNSSVSNESATKELDSLAEVAAAAAMATVSTDSGVVEADKSPASSEKEERRVDDLKTIKSEEGIDFRDKRSINHKSKLGTQEDSVESPPNIPRDLHSTLQDIVVMEQMLKEMSEGVQELRELVVSSETATLMVCNSGVQG
jgi:hypothetical protein